ncbi:MAG: glycosyltransferase family 39 protein [Gemmatimonadota bacterium]
MTRRGPPTRMAARTVACVPILLLALVFVVLVVWTWRRSGDPVIDFGRELYTPWQLASGRVLYRDVASLFGPLSQYLNSLWFRIFGTSVTTLLFANLALIAVITWLLLEVVGAMAGRFTAVLACLVFLAVFAFGHLTFVGNYNYLTPYSHEAVHGIALAVLVVWALHRYGRNGRLRWAALAGAALGATFLTKPEIFAAALAGAATWWLFPACGGAGEGVRDRRSAAVFAGCMLLPPVTAFLALIGPLSPAGAARAVSGGWVHLADRDVWSSVFYAGVSGLDRPAHNAREMLRIALGLGAAAAVAIGFDRIGGRPTGGRRGAVLGVGLVVLLLLLLNLRLIPWLDLARPLPLVAAGAAVLSIGSCLWRRGAVGVERATGEGPEAGARSLFASWSVLSLVLLGRIVLYSRLHHYGFYLAMPATLLTIVILVDRMPAFLSRRWEGGGLFRSVSVVCVGALAGVCVGISHQNYAAKESAVGRGSDRLYVGSHEAPRLGALLQRVLERVDQELGPGAPIAVLPEGAGLNYWLRRPLPTPYVSTMPPELAAYGASAILTSLGLNPPELILLVNRDVTEYGPPRFGADPSSGSAVLAWVRRRYETVVEFTEEGAGGLRIKLLRRRLDDRS